jgi:hypothetical protein
MLNMFTLFNLFFFTVEARPSCNPKKLMLTRDFYTSEQLPISYASN